VGDNCIGQIVPLDVAIDFPSTGNVLHEFQDIFGYVLVGLVRLRFIGAIQIFTPFLKAFLVVCVAIEFFRPGQVLPVVMFQVKSRNNVVKRIAIEMNCFFDKVSIVVYNGEAFVLRVRNIIAGAAGGRTRILLQYSSSLFFLGKKPAASSTFIKKVRLIYDVFIRSTGGTTAYEYRKRTASMSALCLDTYFFLVLSRSPDLFTYLHSVS
jgi:hypothetical protein